MNVLILLIAIWSLLGFGAWFYALLESAGGKGIPIKFWITTCCGPVAICVHFIFFLGNLIVEKNKI